LTSSFRGYDNYKGHRYSFSEEDHSSPDYSSSLSKNVKRGCGSAQKFIDLIADPTKLDPQCGEYNKDVLEQISTIPSGGGYSLKGSATNVTLKMGSTTISNPRAKTSFCTGATYTVAMKVFEKHNVFDKMSDAQKKNFALQHNDNFGFWGAWNNNYEGAGDANRLIKFGERITSLESACAGDFVNFNRKNKSGHSVVYLGQEDGKIYYWSSNKSTKGFGVSCEPVSNIVLSATAITRMTNPSNVANIENFSGQNYAQYYKNKENIPSNNALDTDFLVEASPTNTSSKKHGHSI
jgi:hypothetical protein